MEIISHPGILDATLKDAIQEFGVEQMNLVDIATVIRNVAPGISDRAVDAAVFTFTWNLLNSAEEHK